MTRLGYGMTLCAALASLAVSGYEIPFGKGTAAGEADFYVAPAGAGRLVLKYASVPLFSLERHGAGLTGANGAATAAESENGVVTIRHRDFLNAGPATLHFEGGHLTSFARDADEVQKSKDLAVLTAHPKTRPTLAQLWRRRTTEQEEKAKAAWWRGNARLRLGYFNPNAGGTLCAEIAALFAALALVVRRRGGRLVCAAVASAALVALLQTGSRGSLVALVVGVAVAALLHFGRRLRRRRAVVAALASVLLAGVALFAAGRATGGRFGANLFAVDEGNVQRLRAWRAAPEMMTAAPGGWGEEPGRAYCDWFQDTGDGHRLYYLVNSHLTWMVQHGRFFRCAYASAWLVLLAFLLAFARHGAAQVAAAVWGAFAVALWFSTVGIFLTLWALPALCLGTAALAVLGKAAAQEGRGAAARRFALLSAVAVALGCAAPFALEAVGRRQVRERAVPVRFDGRAVRLGDGEVRTAILRDSTVLAGDVIGGFGHELRDWLERNPSVGAVLVADDPANLPPTVERLVAAGKGAARYLQHRSAHLDDNAYCRARKTLFLSPPFSPDAVPLALSAGTDLRIVIGEFAARCDSGYAHDGPRTAVIPGAELYIPDWTKLALAATGGDAR